MAKSIQANQFYKSEGSGNPSTSFSPPPEESGMNKEDKEEFNLKVTCHSNGALSKKLSAFFNNAQFHDITLKVQDKEFKAHRLVLCVWSGFFKEKLHGLSKSRCPSILDLEMTERESHAFEDVLRFMYTGEISPKEDTVLQICSLAEKYKVRELRRLCEKWTGDDIGDHNIIAASSKLRQAESLGLHHLSRKCIQIFCHYFTKLPDSTWNSLSINHLSQILESINIVADDEWNVFERVEKWVINNGGLEKNTLVIRKEILPKIRFKYMTARQLIAVRKSILGGLVQKYFAGVLEAAFEYRAVAAERKDQSNNSTVQCLESYKPERSPRLYLNFIPPGMSNTNTQTYEKLYLGRYNRVSRFYFHFDANGGYILNPMQPSQFRLEGEAVKCQKEELWYVKFEMNLGGKEGKLYRAVLMVKETQKVKEGEDLGEPECLVLVSEGEVKRGSQGSQDATKVTFTTPPLFDKHPKEVTIAVAVYIFEKKTSPVKPGVS